MHGDQYDDYITKCATMFLYGFNNKSLVNVPSETLLCKHVYMGVSLIDSSVLSLDNRSGIIEFSVSSFRVTSV